MACLAEHGIFSIQARNLAIKMEFKESDELIAKPIKSIYSKDGSCTMTSSLITPVLYHNTSPTFYEEVCHALQVNDACFTL